MLASIAGLDPVALMLDFGSSSALMLSAAYTDAHSLLAGKITSTAALGGIEECTSSKHSLPIRWAWARSK